MALSKIVNSVTLVLGMPLPYFQSCAPLWCTPLPLRMPSDIQYLLLLPVFTLLTLSQSTKIIYLYPNLNECVHLLFWRRCLLSFSCVMKDIRKHIVVKVWCFPCPQPSNRQTLLWGHCPCFLRNLLSFWRSKTYEASINNSRQLRVMHKRWVCKLSLSDSTGIHSYFQS